MDQDLYQRIIAAFKQTGSVDSTAQLCGTYAIKVRKVLITEGLWHSKKSDAVNALRERGYSVSEIAEALGMEEKNVQFYLPYTGNHMSGERTDSSERVAVFRQRSRNAAEGKRTREQESTGRTNPKKNNKNKRSAQLQETNDDFWDKKNRPQCPQTGKWDKKNRPQRPIWRGYGLHVELVRNVYGDPEKDCEDIFDGEEDKEVLRKWIKTKGGISRDIIVPETMSLHQLSYAIQEAFGFMNCHLHHFSLPKKLLGQLTRNNTGLWTELCGVYLHVPVAEDFDDLYWDDDYREGKSPKNWMRTKYTGEQMDYAVGETYLDSLRLLQEAEEWIGDYLKRNDRKGRFKDLPLEPEARMIFEPGNINRVLERLAVRDILQTGCLVHGETEAWRERLRNRIAVSRSYIEAMEDTQTYKSLTDAMEALRMMRTDRHRLDQAIWYDKNGVRQELGRNPETMLDIIEQEIHETEHQIGTAMHAFDPPAEPITDTLYYNYDYGDDWLFRITCERIYSRWEDEPVTDEEMDTRLNNIRHRDPATEQKLKESRWGKDYMLSYEYEVPDHQQVGEPTRTALKQAEQNHVPVCIHAEGLPLIEDVGGPGGFFDLLRTIHGEDKEEAAGYRTWAKGQGWTGTIGKAETLL